jgi:hypothetical protein
VTRPTFADAVRNRLVRLPDGREGPLFYCPARPGYGRDIATVEIGDDLVTVRVDDLEVIGDV